MTGWSHQTLALCLQGSICSPLVRTYVPIKHPTPLFHRCVQGPLLTTGAGWRQRAVCRKKRVLWWCCISGVQLSHQPQTHPSLLTSHALFQGITQAANYIYRKLINDGILNQAFTIAPVSYLPNRFSGQANYTELFLCHSFSLLFLSAGI